MEVFENRSIRCVEDDDFIYSRNVNHACGGVFLLDGDNVFVIIGTNYIGEEVRQYYTICPNCGYIVLLDEEQLSNEMKEAALYKLSFDSYLYKKNNLRSELTYLESISPSVRVRKI